MLVEDDQTMVSLLTTLLTMEGFSVRVPSNHFTEGLINSILKELPDVTLVDVNLRVGNGLDLVREIRQKSEIKHLHIIMCSGLNLKKECLKAGADNFIQKPFMPDELINLIHATNQIKN